MCPRSAIHRPRHDWRALREVSPTQGWISDPYLPSSALHGSHCLSRDFTRSAKPALEKQTSQLSPVMQQCMDSAWVWLLAGPIKCNWPSVTLWSVFQYPVTYYNVQPPFLISRIMGLKLTSSAIVSYVIVIIIIGSYIQGVKVRARVIILIILCIILFRIAVIFLHCAWNSMHYSQNYSWGHYQNNQVMHEMICTLHYMSIPLELYNPIYYFNNVLTVLLKYINLFAMICWKILNIFLILNTKC